METVRDIRILLPSIYEEVLTGFQDALAQREENICVVSIGNIVSYGSTAYNFLYTLMHSRFDPTGSFLQDSYGFKLSSLLRGASTKIMVNKNKFKFPDGRQI